MCAAQWGWTLHQMIPSTKDAGHEAVDRLLAAMTNFGWDGRDYFHVQMAAEEAVINAITHGNHEAVDKSVELEFKVSPSEVFLRMKDEGQGFSIESLPDPTRDEHLGCTNGRGCMLIQAMMTHVQYNERGNEVTMTKVRSAQD